jgi:hypothetical protein
MGKKYQNIEVREKISLQIKINQIDSDSSEKLFPF